MTPLTKRTTKGSALTWAEMDNNWSLIETELSNKAAINHTHAISNVNGLQAAIDGKLGISVVATPNGVASLDATGKVPASQLPSSVAGLWQEVTNTGDIFFIAGNVGVGKNSPESTFDVYGAFRQNLDAVDSNYSKMYSGLISANTYINSNSRFSDNGNSEVVYFGWGKEDENKHAWIGGFYDAINAEEPVLYMESVSNGNSSVFYQTPTELTMNKVAPNQNDGEMYFIMSESETAITNLRITPHRTSSSVAIQEGTMQYQYSTGLQVHDGSQWVRVLVNYWEGTIDPMFNGQSILSLASQGWSINMGAAQMINASNQSVLEWSSELKFMEAANPVASINNHGLSLETNYTVNFADTGTLATKQLSATATYDVYTNAAAPIAPVLLGEPNSWIKIKLNGAEGVIPFYNL